tara:strand:- start:7419 stop:7871 length:453 start_codon:yes stop_codon:yes gene_type:complete
MSSVPELLKKAFESSDWDFVSQAHQMLTGQPLEVSDQEQPVEKTDSSQFISSSKSKEPSSTWNTGGRAKKELIDSNSRVNNFVDDGSIAPEERVSLNPELGVQSPVQRGKRRAPDKISVTCSKCDKRELVLSSLVGNLGTYRCNDCCVNK